MKPDWPIIESSAVPETINSPICGLAVPRSEYSRTVLGLLRSGHELLEREKKSLEFARSEYSSVTYLSRMLHVYKEVVADFPISDNGKFLIEQLRKASAEYWRIKGEIKMASEAPAGRAVKVSLIKKISSFYGQHGFKTTARKVVTVISSRLCRK